MDFGAYAKINDLSHIMSENNINVPRLRGLRLMKNEEPITKEEVDKAAKKQGLRDCELACCSNFVNHSCWYEFSSRTRRLKYKYLVYDDDEGIIEIRWDRIHGKKRKLFKFLMKKAKKRVNENYKMFNKYCGCNDILYIHSRIGGKNWNYFGGPALEKEPWFIEKIDDPSDETYCDIYAKIK